ncbi:MAG: glycosyltransferase [Lachnospiraceae bacterium]|nr:glycosyltransferase [Lachnospiraceae bacterium]
MKKLMLMLPMLHQGGFERVAVATARLLEKDFDVTLCIFSDRNIHYDVSGLKVVNLDVPSRKGKAAKILNVVKRVSRARRLKKKLGTDITYSFGNTANPVNVLSKAGDKVITGLRCGTDLETKAIVRLCGLGSDLVLSCSREIQALLEKDFGCRKTGYIYNPLDHAEILASAGNIASAGSSKELQDRFMIITMGRDDRIKAHWHMIKAFALVSTAHPEARLKIMGAGKYTQYRELAEKLGIAEKVEFTGAVKNPFPEVAQADLYVLPSNREGFPNALVEAMALGKPVIATDCRTGPREILLSDKQLNELLEQAPYGTSTDRVIEGEYGVLIPDMSDVINTDPAMIEDGERRLADAIISMMEDADKRKKYGGRAAQRVLEWSPENYRKDLVDILNKVMEDQKQ